MNRNVNMQLTDYTVHIHVYMPVYMPVRSHSTIRSVGTPLLLQANIFLLFFRGLIDININLSTERDENRDITVASITKYMGRFYSIECHLVYETSQPNLV